MSASAFHFVSTAAPVDATAAVPLPATPAGLTRVENASNNAVPLRMPRSIETGLTRTESDIMDAQTPVPQRDFLPRHTESSDSIVLGGYHSAYIYLGPTRLLQP